MPRRDPRLRLIPPDINSTVRDRAIRHALYLERLKTQQTNAILALVNAAREDVLDQVQRRAARLAERGFDTGPVTTRRLQELGAGLDTIYKETYGQATASLRGGLVALAKQEAVWQSGVLVEATSILPVTVEVVLPSPQLLRSVVSAQPMNGRILKDWLAGIERDAKARVMQQVRLGLVNGEPVEQIVRRLKGTRAAKFRDGILETERRHVRSIVRTAVTHTSNHAREATYEANSDLVKGVQLVETLDSRTCEQCMALDGQVYAVGTGPRPPHHGACRGTTAPVLKSWKELGIPAREIDGETRASANGQVAGKLTYGTWLRGQPAAVQDEALGPTRGALFRRGDLSVDAFTSREGRTLTLDELRAKEPEAFEAAARGAKGPVKRLLEKE